MARELDDLEFWLPSEFLTDFKTDPLKTTRCDDFSYGFGNSFGFSSDLSSPVESVTGTTETESDEDDLITELSRRVAQTTLQDSGLSSGYTTKNPKLSGSPQSTLYGFKSGSRGCPSNAARVYSPPAAEDAPSWDMLYAAAAEVATMRMVEETTAFHSSKLFPPTKHNPASVPQQKLNPAMRFPPNQTQTQGQLSYQQLQAAKFQQMKQQQIMKNGAWEQQGMIEYQLQNARRSNGAGRAQALSMAAWPTLQQSQQNPGLGMRAVFLTENGAKKERIGTGVFMPRRFNSSNPTTETRKKPAAAGCSTVLIPERVAHALNLNLDAIDAKVQNRGHGNLSNQYANNSMNEELGLPQEWTY